MDNHIKLKIKAKTLAAEALIIRREERKALGQARWCANAATAEELAALNQVDGAEARRAFYRRRSSESTGLYQSLHIHRKGIVRSAARETLLAYGYLRGLDYHQIENTAKTQPHWPRIARMIRRYGSSKQIKGFQAWMPEIAGPSLTAVQGELAARIPGVVEGAVKTG